MDYILFGMGFGASLMLFGWALRTFGPGWKYAAVTSDTNPDLFVRKRFWNRFVQGLGGVLAIAGTATVLLTFLVMLSNPDDDTGTMFSLVIWLFVCLIVLGWCLTYLSHYGCTGIWSREEGYGFRSAGDSRSSVIPRSRRSSRVAPNVVASIPSEWTPEPQLGLEPDDFPEGAGSFMSPSDEEVLVVDTASGVKEDSDPAYDFGDAEDVTVSPEPNAREAHTSN